MSHESEINSMLDAFKDASEKNDFNDRKNARARIKQHMLGRHWNGGVDADDFSDPVTNPSLQLTWLAVQRMHPKIFNGYSFEPEVVPEAGQNYTIDPESPLRRAIGAISDPMKNEADSAKEAKLKTAIAQHLWEKSKGLDRLKEGTEGALWYGEWWFLDGWDDGVFLDGLHPDNVRKDPDAKCLEDSRFIGYIVDRTMAQLKEQYPEKKDEIQHNVEQEDDRVKDLPDDKVHLSLECWFTQDNRTKTITEEERVVPELVQQFIDDGYEVTETQTAWADPVVDPMTGMRYHPMTMQPVDIVPPQGFEVVVGYLMQRQYEEPVYHGGWRHIKRVGKTILYDGESYSASGDLPLHWLPCYPTPGELDARGVPDQVQDVNRMIDILYEEALRYVRIAKPGILAREGVLTEASAEQIQIPGGPPVITAHADEEPLSTLIMPYQFPELPGSFQAMIDRLVKMLEEITGSYALQGQNAAYDQLSGEAVEQIETAANARNTAIRERIRNCCRGIVRNMIANAEKYGEKSYAVDIQVAGRDVSMDVDPRIFSADEFEREFDVVIGSTDTLPQAGKSRNEAILAAVGALQQLGPTLAPALLNVLEIPEKQTIEAALGQHFAQIAKNAPMPPQQVEAAKAALEEKKHASQSVDDSLEDFAKRDDISPIVALRIIQYLQTKADGGKMPPVSELIKELTGVDLPQPGGIQGQMPPQPGAIQ